jgi:hypothetical protein
MSNQGQPGRLSQQENRHPHTLPPNYPATLTLPQPSPYTFKQPLKYREVNP